MELKDVINNRWFQIGAAATASFGLGAVSGAIAGVYYIGKKHGREQATYELLEPVPLRWDFGEKIGEVHSVVETEDGLEVTAQIDPMDVSMFEPESAFSGYVPVYRDVAEQVEEQREAWPEPSTKIVSVPEGEEPPTELEEYIHEQIEERLAEEKAKEEESSHNVFKEPDDTWSYEEEEQARAIRAPHDPYVIHLDEWNAAERGYTQTSLQWYEVDEVLTDEADAPIPNPKAVVGELQWGHGSGNDDVCFVRNELLKTEYEVIRVRDSYTNMLLGLRAEEKAQQEDEHLEHRVRRGWQG